MAVRPVFEVALDNRFFVKTDVEFLFSPGFSIKQKQKSITSLHNAFLADSNDKKILEISTKSYQELGVKLSSFNLFLKTVKGNKFSVESAFQASKVFKLGGPYKDLLTVSSKEAKTDPRLKNSGQIIAFLFNGQRFPIEPKTYFYNWLYINALHLHEDLAKQVLAYDAFTDIAFNPEKSLNCQAEAAAIYVSLQKQGLLSIALTDKESFLKIVYGQNNEGKHVAIKQITMFGNDS